MNTITSTHKVRDWNAGETMTTRYLDIPEPQHLAMLDGLVALAVAAVKRSNADPLVVTVSLGITISFTTAKPLTPDAEGAKRE